MYTIVQKSVHKFANVYTLREREKEQVRVRRWEREGSVWESKRERTNQVREQVTQIERMLVKSEEETMRVRECDWVCVYARVFAVGRVLVRAKLWVTERECDWNERECKWLSVWVGEKV